MNQSAAANVETLDISENKPCVPQIYAVLARILGEKYHCRVTYSVADSGTGEEYLCDAQGYRETKGEAV